MCADVMQDIRMLQAYSQLPYIRWHPHLAGALKRRARGNCGPTTVTMVDSGATKNHSTPKLEIGIVCCSITMT